MAARFPFSFWKLGVSSFVPTDLTGLSVWLKADVGLYDATTGGSLVAANGSIARWEDQSGNGRHVTQATSGARPIYKTAIINSLPIVRFDGTDDEMQTATWAQASSGTLFILFQKRSDPVVNGRFVEIGSNNHIAITSTPSGTGFTYNLGSNFNFINTANKANNTTFIAVATMGSGSFNGYAHTNNVQEGNINAPGTASTLALFLSRYGGGSYWTPIDIGEIVFYNTGLSSTDRGSVTTYLANRWGVAI